jgi:hypothetical protein
MTYERLEPPQIGIKCCLYTLSYFWLRCAAMVHFSSIKLPFHRSHIQRTGTPVRQLSASH